MGVRGKAIKIDSAYSVGYFLPKMASQAHGFIWEAAIKYRAFRVLRPYPYTAPFDIPAEDNRFNGDENISIKTCKGDRAECGDPLRIFGYANYPTVTMIALRYKQDTSTTKKLQHIHEISIGGAATHDILFGAVTEEEVKELIALVKRLPPPGPGHDEIRAAVHAEKKRLNEKSGIIRFNPKMDSKGQKRIQCSIPKLSSFISAYPGLLISSTTEPIVRGVEIPTSIESVPRQRNY